MRDMRKKFQGTGFLVEIDLRRHILEAQKGINLGKGEKEALEIAMKIPKKLLCALKDEENIKNSLQSWKRNKTKKKRREGLILLAKPRSKKPIQFFCRFSFFQLIITYIKNFCVFSWFYTKEYFCRIKVL